METHWIREAGLEEVVILRGQSLHDWRQTLTLFCSQIRHTQNVASLWKDHSFVRPENKGSTCFWSDLTSLRHFFVTVLLLIWSRTEKMWFIFTMWPNKVLMKSSHHSDKQFSLSFPILVWNSRAASEIQSCWNSLESSCLLLQPRSAETRKPKFGSEGERWSTPWPPPCSRRSGPRRTSGRGLPIPCTRFRSPGSVLEWSSVEHSGKDQFKKSKLSFCFVIFYLGILNQIKFRKKHRLKLSGDFRLHFNYWMDVSGKLKCNVAGLSDSQMPSVTLPLNVEKTKR